MIPSREQAYALLCRYNQSEALRKHALAVEGCMRHFAKRAGQDEELWGLAGLLHDLDYEMYPQEHCAKGAELLPGPRVSMRASSGPCSAMATASAPTWSRRRRWKKPCMRWMS